MNSRDHKMLTASGLALRLRTGGIQPQQDTAVYEEDCVKTPLAVEALSPLEISQLHRQHDKEDSNVQNQEESGVRGRQ